MQEYFRQKFQTCFFNYDVCLSSFENDENNSVYPCMYIPKNGINSFNYSSLENLLLLKNLEEADHKIIPHIIHSTEARAVILSSDTDVFILLLHHFRKCNKLEMWFRTGNRDNIRCIPIHKLVEIHGTELCNVLPAAHILTGCDYTSKIGSKKSILKINPIKFLKNFGLGPIESCTAQAEEFLVLTIKPRSSCKTFDELRAWFYYNSKNFVPENLPPTSFTCADHIKRAYYCVDLYFNCDRGINYDPLDVTKYGFELEADNEFLKPICNLRCIPENFLLMCSCKTKCEKKCCTCKKNGVLCSKFCKCNNFNLCKNK